MKTFEEVQKAIVGKSPAEAAKMVKAARREANQERLRVHGIAVALTKLLNTLETANPDAPAQVNRGNVRFTMGSRKKH